MSAYLVIGVIEAVILVVLWRWDQRARRAELDRRRRLRLMQMSGRPADGAATAGPGAPFPVAAAAGQRSG